MCGVAQGDACGIGDCCANPLRKAGAARQIAASGSYYRSDFVFDLDLDLDLDLAFDLDLLLIFKPLREAERRFCAVVLPARMPGEPCWAMDGPSRRGHGAGPERGNLSAAKAVRWGQGLFGSFCGCLTKGTRCKSETDSRVKRL